MIKSIALCLMLFYILVTAFNIKVEKPETFDQWRKKKYKNKKQGLNYV